MSLAKEFAPYLSVVVTARNDNHGGNLLRRMQIFVDGLLAQFDRHRLPGELILVEWNPPADEPRLTEALTWPAQTAYGRVRVIEVPNQVHSHFKHAESLPLYQMIAKNVGIRRARGEFVLSTNIDLLFSDDLMALIARRGLEPHRMYRCDRIDVGADVPDQCGLDQKLDYCHDHFLRICERDGILVPDKGEYHMVHLPRELQGSGGKRDLTTELHTNGCGDFTLLSRQDWFDLRGYAEFDMFSLHLDSLFCYAAHFGGCQEVIWEYPLVTYHIDHASGWNPDDNSSGSLFQRLEEKGVAYLSNQGIKSVLDKVARAGQRTLFNDPEWGLARLDLPETVLTEPGGTPVEPALDESRARTVVPANRQRFRKRLAVVVASRNDDHGEGLLGRTQSFIDGLADQCRRFRLDAELIMVDWNPPQDRPPLAQALDFSACGERLSPRLITVPPEVHRHIPNADRIHFFQMMAKNVGIRRAQSDFILATNVDIIFSDQLMEHLAQGNLARDALYRVDRFDVADRALPRFESHQELLDYCARSVTRVHRKEGRSLHTNACGDFTLMYRDLWHGLRAYAELPLWSIYLDGVLLAMAAAAGIKEIDLEDPYRIYHIEHGKGWALDQSPAETLPHLDFDRDYVPWCRQMVESGQVSTPNRGNWGMSERVLEEVDPRSRPSSQRQAAPPEELKPMAKSKASKKKKSGKKGRSGARVPAPAGPPTLTIFTVPKDFVGHWEVIQRNALISWTLMRPRPEILVLGQAQGAAEVCRELGLIHVPDIEVNEFGTPLVSSIFAQAQARATCPRLAYVNTDVILMSDLLSAAERCAAQFESFLMVGQRWDLALDRPWDFSRPGWDKALMKRIKAGGELHAETGIDYFLFTAGFYQQVPPFAVGRTAWDNWLVAHPLNRSEAVIDATPSVNAIHQNHDYSHLAGGKLEAWQGVEARRNREMAGLLGHWGVTSEASWVLEKDGLHRRESQEGQAGSPALLRKMQSGINAVEMAYRGQELLQQGSYAEALEVFDEAVSAIRDYDRWQVDNIYFARGLTRFHLGRLEEARADVLQELEHQPGHQDSLKLLAQIEARLGKAACPQEDHQAIGARRFLDEEPGKGPATVEEAERLFHEGDLHGAHDTLVRVLKKAPGDVTARNDLAVVLWQLGTRRAAIKHLQKALETDPSHRESVWNLGHFLAIDGQGRQAHALWSAWLSRHPEDAELAQALAGLGRPAEKRAAAF